MGTDNLIWILTPVLTTGIALLVGGYTLLSRRIKRKAAAEAKKAKKKLQAKKQQQKQLAEEKKSRGESSQPAVNPIELLRHIKARRSVFPKDYTGEPVPKEVVQSMLEAANWAPTHGKTEPWRFVVMSGREQIRAFLDAQYEAVEKQHGGQGEKWEKFKAKFHRKLEQRLKCAHMIAIVCKRVEKRGKPGQYMPLWEEIAAVSCGVQNMHLVCAAHGVAGYWSSGGWGHTEPETGREVWDGRVNLEPVRSMLGLGEKDFCMGVFHVGQSDRIAKYRSSRGDIKDKVMWLASPTEGGSATGDDGKTSGRESD